MVGVASFQSLFLKHGMEKGELRETEVSRVICSLLRENYLKDGFFS